MKIPQLWKRRQALKEAHNQALKAIETAHMKWTKPTNFQAYKPGDKVWLEATNLHTTHPMQKLRPKCYGPFEILETIGPVNFRLHLPDQWKIHNVFHAKLLHPYQETKEYGINFQKPPPNLIEGEEEEEWEVEQILDEQICNKEQQYLIHWKGYSDAHNSWEPMANINAPDLIASFQRGKQKRNKVQKNTTKKTAQGRTAHLRTVRTEMSSNASSPPSSMDSNECSKYYARCLPTFLQTQPISWSPTPDNVEEDIGHSVSEHGTPPPDTVLEIVDIGAEGVGGIQFALYNLQKTPTSTLLMK